MPQHLDIGREGEDMAVAYLRGLGYKIIARNVANPYGKRLGELDIVATEGKEIVFVEVKTLQERSDGDTWLPEWQVSSAKLKKLDRIAEFFLKKEKLLGRDYRFDVIAITLPLRGEPRIKHLEHVFL